MNELLQPKEKKVNVHHHTFIGTFVLSKGKFLYHVISIRKGKYAYLDLVYFGLAYI